MLSIEQGYLLQCFIWNTQGSESILQSINRPYGTDADTIWFYIDHFWIRKLLELAHMAVEEGLILLKRDAEREPMKHKDTSLFLNEVRHHTDHPALGLNI